MRNVLILSAALAQSAHAGTVTLAVRDASGKPLADAIVMIDSPGRKDAAAHFPGPYVMAQQNISFQPHVLIVPVGATVAFPNRDRVRHHVYSFSTIKKFEMKLYGRDETRSVVFDKPGVAALGCNIHDSMSGFVVVVDTPFAARTDAAGNASIPGVPAGRAMLRIWHPSIRAPGGQLSQELTVPQALLSKAVTVSGK